MNRLGDNTSALWTVKVSTFEIIRSNQLVIKLSSLETDIIVPTFDTKVTEYLCSGWVFFSSDKFRLLN